MGVGKQLEKILEEIDMNVNEFSNALGVRPQRIYNIIARDTKKVDKELVRKMSKVLGVPIDYFYSDNSIDSYLRSEERKPITFSTSSRNKLSDLELEELREMRNAEMKRRRETYDGGSRILTMRFHQLNDKGRKELLKRASELVRLEEYTLSPEDTKEDKYNS